MKASEDTKCGPSVVAETLLSLSEQARVCHEKINLLEAGQSFNRADVLAEVGKLLDACQNLRDAILSEDNGATWTTKSELSTLVGRLDDAAAKRRRYLDLAEVLATGTISHRRERTRLERLALRDKAVAELMEVSDQPAPPELPGPVAENWLEWACSLEDDINEPELQKLKGGFPRLDDFVRQLEIDWWHDDPAPKATEKRKSVTSISKHSNGSHVNGNGNGHVRQPVLEEPQLESTVSVASPAREGAAPFAEVVSIAEIVSIAEVPPVEAAASVAEVAPIVEAAPITTPSFETLAVNSDDKLEAGLPVLTAGEAAPSFVDEEVVELPAETLNPTQEGPNVLLPMGAG